MGPVKTILHDDVMIDHIQLLATHSAQIAQHSEELKNLGTSMEKTNAKVDKLDRNLLIIQTKWAALGTLAVFGGNLAFQIFLRIFF